MVECMYNTSSICCQSFAIIHSYHDARVFSEHRFEEPPLRFYPPMYAMSSAPTANRSF
jgi:hypothetical protein